jgi:solute carrier family 27 fatty acid transporter 1/4
LYIIDTDDSLDLDRLASGIRQKLPKYARPLFIRIIRELKLTGTYKLVKRDLQKEGYDVTQVQDPIYFMGPKDMVYKRLDGELHQQFQSELMVAKL